MNCPNCNTNQASDAYQCANCNYGIEAPPKPGKSKARYLGDDGLESYEEAFGRTFQCFQCKSFGATVGRLAAPAVGLVQIQGNPQIELFAVSCEFCGLVQFYNSNIALG